MTMTIDFSTSYRGIKLTDSYGYLVSGGIVTSGWIRKDFDIKLATIDDPFSDPYVVDRRIHTSSRELKHVPASDHFDSWDGGTFVRFKADIDPPPLWENYVQASYTSPDLFEADYGEYSSALAKFRASFDKQKVADAVYGDAGGVLAVIHSSKALIPQIFIYTDVIKSEIIGSRKADIFRDGDLANTLSGGRGNDTIGAGAANDIVSGDAGNDTLGGGFGSDKMFGGTGNDQISGDGGESKGGFGTGPAFLPGGDTISGGDGRDNIEGGAGNDTLSGDDGNDVIYGDDGRDTLDGGDGNDRLDGGADSDKLLGGKGEDQLDGRDGADALAGGDDDDIVQGGFGGDRLTGDGGADKLYGDDNSDNLKGGEGDDILEGNDGTDKLDGGTNYDELNGGLGKDILTGGEGNGLDIFIFDSALGGGNVDTITDFGGRDGFLLSTVIFPGIHGEVDKGEFRLGTSAADGDDRIIYDPATGHLSYDPDGTLHGANSASQVLFAILANKAGVTFVDFIT